MSGMSGLEEILGRGGLTASSSSVAGVGLIPTLTAALARIGEDGAPEGVGGCGVVVAHS